MVVSESEVDSECDSAIFLKKEEGTCGVVVLSCPFEKYKTLKVKKFFFFFK